MKTIQIIASVSGELSFFFFLLFFRCLHCSSSPQCSTPTMPATFWTKHYRRSRSHDQRNIEDLESATAAVERKFFFVWRSFYVELHDHFFVFVFLCWIWICVRKKGSKRVKGIFLFYVLLFVSLGCLFGTLFSLLQNQSERFWLSPHSNLLCCIPKWWKEGKESKTKGGLAPTKKKKVKSVSPLFPPSLFFLPLAIFIKKNNIVAYIFMKRTSGIFLWNMTVQSGRMLGIILKDWCADLA